MLKQKMLRRKRFCMTRSFSPLDVGDHNQSAFDKADLSSSKAKMQFEHDLEANLRSFEKGQKHRSLMSGKSTCSGITQFLNVPVTSGADTEIETTFLTNSVTQSCIVSQLSGPEVLDAEIKWVVKCCTSYYSTNSCEGIASLFSDMFPDSSIAKKFSCGATKCAYILNFGLAFFLKNKMVDCVNKADCFTILFDESLNNKTQSKQMDVHVRFWNSQCIVTRYYTSVFLGHSTAEVTLAALYNAMEKLDLKKVLSLSMDGPAVNWKIFRMLQENLSKDFGTTLLDVGSCGLHTLHNCVKNASREISWGIEDVLSSIYWLFQDAPARREDFLNQSEKKKLPRKFCAHRWLENSVATERALEIWNDICNYVRAVEKGELPQPKCKSYQIMAQACNDVFIQCRLHFFLSVVNILQPFLKGYQTDWPMIPFLAQDLHKAAINCAKTFNVMKQEDLKELRTPLKLINHDFKNKKSSSNVNEVSMGFIADRLLKDLLRDKKITNKDIKELKLQAQFFIYTLLHELVTKSPLRHTIIRLLSCLDPKCMSSDTSGCYKKMKQLLTILSKSSKGEAKDCDFILLQFNDFLNDISSKHLNFDRSVSRVDCFLYEKLIEEKYEKLRDIVKMLLTISHGQASVERGFSINTKLEVENLKEENYTSKRLVLDEINSCGGLKNFTISKELRIAVNGARQRYISYLGEQKKMKLEEGEGKKRKILHCELEDLKEKKSSH